MASTSTQVLMQRLRALCDQHGIPLIAGLVVTGAGRTGTSSLPSTGIVPDLTTQVGRRRLPSIPGVAGKAEIMDAIAPGRLRAHLCRQPDRRAPRHWPR